MVEVMSIFIFFLVIMTIITKREFKKFELKEKSLKECLYEEFKNEERNTPQKVYMKNISNEKIIESLCNVCDEKDLEAIGNIVKAIS